MSRPVVGFAGMTHLGVNSAAAAAARGFETVCFDAHSGIVTALDSGNLSIVEPGLPELLSRNRQRMVFTTEPMDLKRCDVVYISSDVPTDDQGQSELSGIRSLVDTVTGAMGPEAILVILCQVPPGFTRALALPKERLYYQVETLIFGRALERAMHPEQFVVGCAAPERALPPAYGTFLSTFGCPVVPMGYESAELTKIGINCCLVASLTVANTLAELCEQMGADWGEIASALKLDERIGPHAYLAPGLGLGGGNLERDLATVCRLADAHGSDAGVVRAWVKNSSHRRDWALRTLHRGVLAENPRAVIGLLGLAYKENTHSTKNSPSLALIAELGPWRLRVHDPVVPASAVVHPNATECASPLEAAQGADALVIMTPWPAFRHLQVDELARSLTGRTVIDPYHVLDGRAVAAAGLDYFTLGAPPLQGRPQS